MPTRLARAQVPVDQTWNLNDLFADDAAWAAECRAVDEARQAFAAWQGQVGRDAATLLAGLVARESLELRLMRVGTFARLRNAQDGTDARHQAAAAQVTALHARVDAATSFVDAEILALPDGQLQRWMADEPGLADFRVPLSELLAQRPHRLSAEAERALATLGEVLQAPAMIYNRSKAGDIRFAPFTDGAGTVHANSFNGFESRHESAADAGVRRAAWASFSAGLQAHHHTWGATFATEVGKRVTVGADKAYDTKGFVKACREIGVTPHVAQNTYRTGGSAIDGRTTRHDGYAISQRKRKCIEQCFGWGKVIGPIRQVMVQGLDKVDQLLTLTMAAYNLTRLRTLAQLRPQFAQ